MVSFGSAIVPSEDPEALRFARAVGPVRGGVHPAAGVGSGLSSPETTGTQSQELAATEIPGTQTLMCARAA